MCPVFKALRACLVNVVGKCLDKQVFMTTMATFQGNKALT